MVPPSSPSLPDRGLPGTCVPPTTTLRSRRPPVCRGLPHFGVPSHFYRGTTACSFWVKRPLRFATFPFGRVRFRALYPLAIIRLPSTFRASVARSEDQPASGYRERLAGVSLITSDPDMGLGPRVLAPGLVWGARRLRIRRSYWSSRQ